MPGPDFDDIDALFPALPVHGPTSDVRGHLEELRGRLRERLDEVRDEAALQGAELALVALAEPLDPGPVTALLHHLADHLERAMQQQDDEMADLRRKLRDRDQQLHRLRGGGGGS